MPYLIISLSESIRRKQHAPNPRLNTTTSSILPQPCDPLPRVHRPLLEGHAPRHPPSVLIYATASAAPLIRSWHLFAHISDVPLFTPDIDWRPHLQLALTVLARHLPPHAKSDAHCATISRPLSASPLPLTPILLCLLLAHNTRAAEALIHIPHSAHAPFFSARPAAHPARQVLDRPARRGQDWGPGPSRRCCGRRRSL